MKIDAAHAAVTTVLTGIQGFDEITDGDLQTDPAPSRTITTAHADNPFLSQPRKASMRFPS